MPEKREEVTTEGGLDVVSYFDSVADACRRLGEQNIEVSLFIDPEFSQIDAAVEAGAPVVELHTGAYAEASGEAVAEELKRLQKATGYGLSKGLIVNAGHGLNYQNVEPVAAIPGMNELNIGHSIIGRAVFTGLKGAVKEMKSLMVNAADRA